MMDKENHPNLIVIPQQGVLYIEETEPRYLEGLAKLMKRKSPWRTKHDE
jgi:hypothetical protein